MYIKSLSVDADQVIHYPWLDTTTLYVKLDEYLIKSKDKLFLETYSMILYTALIDVINTNVENDFFKVSGKNFSNGNYLQIQLREKIYRSDEMKKYGIDTCNYILNKKFIFKDDFLHTDCYTNNLEDFNELTKEILNAFETNNFKYYFQSVDGMD